MTFYRYTYGAELPDDDDGRECFFVLACEVTRLNGEPERNVRRHAKHWCPWMEDDELDALVRRVLRRPYRWRAETLGRKLGLLDGIRTRLRITTIGAIDMTRRQRAKRTREKQNAKRRTMTRAEYLAEALSRTRPWDAEGISRRTWYRRRAADAKFERLAAFLRGGTGGSLGTSPRPFNILDRRAHTCAKQAPRQAEAPLAWQAETDALSERRNG